MRDKEEIKRQFRTAFEEICNANPCIRNMSNIHIPSLRDDVWDGLCLERDRWDDYGYNTVYHLFTEVPKYKELGCVRLFQKNEIMGWDPNPFIGNHVCFICNEETAIKIRENYSEDEIGKLIRRLNIKFDPTEYIELPVFSVSILRFQSLKSFTQEQLKIRKILIGY